MKRNKRLYRDTYHSIFESDGDLPFIVKRTMKSVLPDGTPYKPMTLPRRCATLKEAVAKVEELEKAFELPEHIRDHSPLVNAEPKKAKPKSEPKPVGRPKKRQKPGPKAQPKRKQRSDKAPYFPEYSLGRFRCTQATELVAIYECTHTTPEQYAYDRTKGNKQFVNISEAKMMRDFGPYDCIVVRFDWAERRDGSFRSTIIPETVGRGRKKTIRKFTRAEAERFMTDLMIENKGLYIDPKKNGNLITTGHGFEIHWAINNPKDPATPFVIFNPAPSAHSNYFSNRNGIVYFKHLHEAINKGQEIGKKWAEPFSDLYTAVQEDDGTGDTNIRITHDKLAEIKGHRSS